MLSPLAALLALFYSTFSGAAEKCDLNPPGGVSLETGNEEKRPVLPSGAQGKSSILEHGSFFVAGSPPRTATLPWWRGLSALVIPGAGEGPD